MACACSKRRQPTGFAITPRRAANGEEVPVEKFTLKRPDGGIEIYGSRLEALAARVRAGGGEISEG